MLPGNLAGHFDAAQLAVMVFFAFFAGLIYHLRREDKREGFPLEGTPGHGREWGFPPPPPTKYFPMLDGTIGVNPNNRADEPPPDARPVAPFEGAPLMPHGDPLRANLGPGAVGWKRDKPLLDREDDPMVQPLRRTRGWRVAAGDVDPRGLRVLGRDRVAVGTVSELWVDRSVKILRYLEVTLDSGRVVLLPIYHADVRGRRDVLVRALRTEQFAEVPPLAEPDQITGREEDRINAFYAAAELFR